MSIMDGTEELILIKDNDVEFEDFMRGQCIYKCRICDRKYFDRWERWL